MRMNVCILLLAIALMPAAVSAQEDEVSKYDFIEVDETPTPLQDVQELIVYPDSAREAGIEGKVVASSLIEEDGTVKKVEIERSAHPILDDAAVSALRKMTYTPAKQKGVPVKVWYTQSIVFRLRDPE